ncbi:MAG: outer membrane protein assembly factor BamC, partial [Candidatus Oxydemutatoraceae bacterium WSBS_2016_MAG_OTU14]
LPVLGETSSHKELVVPPGYVAPEVSEAFEIPGSERSMRREAMNSPVLPAQAGLQLYREGNVAWLEIGLRPVETWDYLRNFISGYGFKIVNESPTSGTLETNWLEHKLNNSVGGVPVRDRFRVRIEREANARTSIYIANHKSVYQRGEWQVAVSDIDTEMSLLKDMHHYFSQLQRKGGQGTSEVIIEDQTLNLNIVDVAGIPVLTIGSNYSAVWRRLGLALDRSDINIKNSDRSRGILIVEYTPKRNRSYTAVELRLLTKQGDVLITAHSQYSDNTNLPYETAHDILQKIVWTY